MKMRNSDKDRKYITKNYLVRKYEIYCLFFNLKLIKTFLFSNIYSKNNSN